MVENFGAGKGKYMDGMVEILSLDISIDESFEVESEAGRVNMILFHGTAGGDYFTGKVLPGGVDTQIYNVTGKNSLSARYILEGTDYTGEQCRIFIENNGKPAGDGSIITKPVIYTDSKALRTFMYYDAVGTVTPSEGGVHITFYMEE